MKLGTLAGRMRTLFLQGVALLAPLVVTIALLIWLARSVEVFVGDLLRHVLPAEFYVPGMGLAAAALGTLGAGLIANLFLVRWLVRLVERIVDRIPLVKSLFQGLKDIARLLTRGGDQELGRVVTVEIQGIQLVGFVMQERAYLPGQDQDDPGQRIAVYLPMSYQVGGYTLYLDRDRVRPLEISADDAMRAVLTGGSLRHGDRSEQGRPKRGKTKPKARGQHTPSSLEPSDLRGETEAPD